MYKDITQVEANGAMFLCHDCVVHYNSINYASQHKKHTKQHPSVQKNTPLCALTAHRQHNQQKIRTPLNNESSNEPLPMTGGTGLFVEKTIKKPAQLQPLMNSICMHMYTHGVCVYI